ncbi:MAG: hypothetical protein HOW73_50665 [Polyangiaceae bacterium]|nr:hypothetical protein [Polyangiaceae bacterium]
MADLPRVRTTARVPRVAVALLSLVLGCGNEGPNGAGTGEIPTNVSPPPTVSPTITPEQFADEDVPPDAAVGLEFDPVSGRLIIPEAGPPEPKALRADAKLTTDTMPRDEQAGMSLQATFLPRAVPAAYGGPEVSAEGLAGASKLTAPLLTIGLTAMGRMKIIFESRSLPLPYRSELRARFDRYGHLVFWPSSSMYRIIPPGALRTVLGERRVDVTPLTPAQKLKSGTGTRLEQPTRVVELEGSLGTIKLELVSFPEAGLGGPLLCRALVETMGIDPSTSECKPEEVPFGASLNWKGGDGIDFVVTGFERRSDVAPNEVMVPPPASERVDTTLPDSSDGVYLTQEELGAFRTKAIDVKPADPSAPPDGFIAENGRDQLMVLWLDGVPVVAVPALDRRFIIGPLPGRYVAQWRTFLGDRIDEARVVELPGIVRSVTAPAAADAGP